MAALVFSSFVALAALVGFALAVAWVRRSPPIGVALIGLILIPMWERPQFRSPIVTFAGSSLYIADVVALTLFVAGLLQVRQLRANLRGWFFPWALFGTMLAIALLRAVVASDGPASAINSGRWLLYFFWAMTWVFGVRPDRFRLHTISLVFGWALVLVAVYHGVRYGVGGSSSTLFIGDGIVRTGRVLIAPQSMALLLCAATVYLYRSDAVRSRPRFDAFSSLVFVLTVVIAQHRSVWAAGAAGMFAALLWSARTRARKQLLLQLAASAGILLLVGSSGLLSTSTIAESASDTQTYDWRYSGWRVLISEAIARGPTSVIFGEPSAGTFFRRLGTGQETSVSAHNWYVDIFLYLGPIALLLVVAILVSALVTSREVSAAWTFVLAAVAAYGWAYSVEWFLAPWLGAAIVGSLGAGRIAEYPDSVSDLVAKPNSARVIAGNRHGTLITAR
jgi:hypothetical protein